MTGQASSRFRIIQAHYDAAAASLTVWSAHDSGGRTVHLGHDDVGRGLLEWLARQVAALERGGRVTSSKTVREYGKHLGRAAAFLRDHGVGSFTDRELTWDVARRLAGLRRNEPSWRSPVVNALAHAVAAAGHPDDMLRHAVAGLVRGPQATTAERAYTAGQARQIIDVARDVWTRWVATVRTLLEELGMPTTEQHLRQVTAAEIRAAAVATHGRTGSVVAAAVVAWIDTPDGFRNKRWPDGIDKSAALRVREILKVTNARLAAAATLMAVDRDDGHNEQPLTSLRPADTTVQPNGTTVTELVKTRHHGRYKVVSNARQMYSFGGVATRLAWLTTLERHRRRTAAATPAGADAADLLFNATFYAAPKFAALKGALPEGLTLSLRRLRKWVVSEQILDGKRPRLAGASRNQVQTYYVAALPDQVLDRIIVSNIDNMVAVAEQHLATLDKADPARVEPDVDPATELERGVATCESAGTDPDTGDRCQRGILGCFGCPSARITRRNAAGLAAAVQLTRHIRDHGSDEWASGPAPAVLAFATAALKRLRADPEPEHVRVALPIVMATYHEARG